MAFFFCSLDQLIQAFFMPSVADNYQRSTS